MTEVDTTVGVGHDARLLEYKIYATNRGPSASSLDVYADRKLTIVRLVCDQGVSPDTPACEYRAASGETEVTTVFAYPPTGSGRSVTATFCAVNEGDTVDPNSANNCLTVTTTLHGSH